MTESHPATKTIDDLPLVDYNYDEAVMRGTLAVELAQAAQQHGPIFRRVVRGGPQHGATFVFMVGPDANRFVLHSHRDHFSHDLGWTPLIGETMGKGLLNMDDPEHAVHRKLWNPAFAQSYLAAYLPIIAQVIAERTRDWPTRGVIDVYSEAREITFDIAAGALAGIENRTRIDHLRQRFYTLLHGFDSEREAWDDFFSRAMLARREIDMLLRELIAERRRTSAERARDVLGTIVHARDEEGNTLDDDQLIAHINILLVAGHETTTTLAAWMLYLLATQPAHRERIRAELAALPADAPLTLDTLRTSRHLDYFIREAGRIYSPVLNVPRGVVKPFTFNGYTIPAGTSLRLGLAATHRLPTLFEQPEQFDPDRFAPPNVTSAYG